MYGLHDSLNAPRGGQSGGPAVLQVLWQDDGTGLLET